MHQLKLLSVAVVLACVAIGSLTEARKLTRVRNQEICGHFTSRPYCVRCCKVYGYDGRCAEGGEEQTKPLKSCACRRDSTKQKSKGDELVSWDGSEWKVVKPALVDFVRN